jgi:hypothetical protein
MRDRIYRIAVAEKDCAKHVGHRLALPVCAPLGSAAKLTRLGGYRLMVASPKVRRSAANLIHNRRN